MWWRYLNGGWGMRWSLLSAVPGHCCIKQASLSVPESSRRCQTHPPPEIRLLRRCLTDWCIRSEAYLRLQTAISGCFSWNIIRLLCILFTDESFAIMMDEVPKTNGFYTSLSIHLSYQWIINDLSFPPLSISRRLSLAHRQLQEHKIHTRTHTHSLM